MANTETSEARLKAAVIDRLISTGVLAGDSVLVSEMTVANWSRRADIAVANGRLWGFELKSAADRLTRLPAQIETFLTYYEKLVIVVAARFERNAREIIDSQGRDRIGLWVEDECGALIERKRPRSEILSKTAAVRLMTAEELRRTLSHNRISTSRAARRAELELAATELSQPVLADAAREAIKLRFREPYQAFISEREHWGSLKALRFLRRTTAVDRSEASVQSTLGPVPSIRLSATHPAYMEAPGGPVLRRLRQNSPNSSSASPPAEEKAN